jgi:hypothetical protein
MSVGYLIHAKADPGAVWDEKNPDGHSLAQSDAGAGRPQASLAAPTAKVTRRARRC